MLRSQQDKNIKQGEGITKQRSEFIDTKNMKERPSISNTSKLVKTVVERGKSKVTRKISLAKG